MKKFFLLIPALILSMMMNATVTNITPASPYASDAIRLALYYSSDGDTIVLAEGVYVESNSDYIAWKRSNVVMAAEGASVIIKPHVSFRVRNGARAELIGVKIDASELNANDPATSYENIFEAGDANEGNRLILENCEIYGNVSKTMLRCASDKKLDSLIINNCYIHDNAQATLRMQSTSLKGVIITNTTIANVANGGSFWCAPMDISSTATDAKVIVDHCTFYHNTSISSSYADVTTGVDGSATSDVTITNCIFAQPASYDGSRAINLTNGGTVRNCLTFNYTKSTNGIQGATVKENCIAVDPLFTDVANADYSFPGNWVTPSISPARAAATDGSDLGDPRWHSAEVLPSVDFASNYDLLGAKAQLSGNIELNESSHIKYTGSSTPGVATWKMHIEKACALSGVIDMEDGNTSGCTLKLIAFDADGNKVDSLVAPYTDKDENVPVAGCMYIPAEGNYTFKLYNGTGWSSSKIEKIILSYVGGETQSIPGTMDVEEAWFSSKGSRADGMITFTSYTDQWVKWNAATANTKAYDVTLNINNPTAYGHRFTVAIYEDEDEAPVASFTESSWNETFGEPLAINMGSALLQSGKNYIVKVTNAESGAQPKVISVGFAAIGGGLVDIPGDIDFDEVILSSRAYIDANGEIRFTDDDHAGYIEGEWAKWRLNVSKAGYYKFTTSVNSPNGHSYLVSVYNADETVLKGSGNSFMSLTIF